MGVVAVALIAVAGGAVAAVKADVVITVAQPEPYQCFL